LGRSRLEFDRLTDPIPFFFGTQGNDRSMSMMSGMAILSESWTYNIELDGLTDQTSRGRLGLSR